MPNSNQHGQETILRPCSLCEHKEPKLTVLGDDRVRFILVMRPERGALGPRATGDDPPGHAGTPLELAVRGALTMRPRATLAESRRHDFRATGRWLIGFVKRHI